MGFQWVIQGISRIYYFGLIDNDDSHFCFTPKLVDAIGVSFGVTLSQIKRKINARIRAADKYPQTPELPAIQRFLDRRNAARLGAIAVIGALRGPPGAYGARGDKSDAAKIIARVIWESRVFYK